MDSKLTPQTYKLIQYVYAHELFNIALKDNLQLINYNNSDLLLCSQHLKNEQDFNGVIINNLLACINDTTREPVINLILINVFYYLFLHKDNYYIYNESFIKHLLKVKDQGKYSYIDYPILKLLFDIVKTNFKTHKPDDSYSFINNIDF
jgi:hypothetical protein